MTQKEIKKLSFGEYLQYLKDEHPDIVRVYEEEQLRLGSKGKTILDVGGPYSDESGGGFLWYASNIDSTLWEKVMVDREIDKWYQQFPSATISCKSSTSIDNYAIGDTVIGLPSASTKYGITQEGWEGVIIGKKGETLHVRGSCGDFWVEHSYFAVVKKDSDYKRADTKAAGCSTALTPDVPICTASPATVIGTVKTKQRTKLITAVVSTTKY